ncbi:type IV pilus modification protein PilV, partial [Pandoraea pneumonica]
AIDTVNQVYRVTVAWQGLVKTVVPSLPCGSGNFGSDGYRRAISVQVRMGVLS